MVGVEIHLNDKILKNRHQYHILWFGVIFHKKILVATFQIGILFIEFDALQLTQLKSYDLQRMSKTTFLLESEIKY